MSQAVFPVGDGDAVGLFNLCLVEHAVGRAACRGGVVGTHAGLHIAAGDACKAVNGFGEVVPRNSSLVAVVEDACVPCVSREERRGVFVLEAGLAQCWRIKNTIMPWSGGY